MGGCVFARGRRRGGGAGVADDRGRLRGDNAACGGERTVRRAAILGYGDTHTLTAQASSGVEPRDGRPRAGDEAARLLGCPFSIRAWYCDGQHDLRPDWNRNDDPTCECERS